MTGARVLIVSPSVVLRKAVADLLAAPPPAEPPATAATAGVALARLEACPARLVLLDAALPEADRRAVLDAARRHAPTAPVVLFGPAGAPAPVAAGADAAVALPEEGPNAAEALRVALRRALAPAAPSPLAALRPPTPTEVVAVAASTGGPVAVGELLAALAPGLPVPVVIVLHMPPLFTGLLAERLAAQTGMPVRQAADGDALAAGGVWVAPGDRHLSVTRAGLGARLRVADGPPENSCRPSADVLFRSAAAAYGAGVLAVVLTGMGRDGLSGCGRVRLAGGVVLAQDEATSVVWGMPGYVARAGLADAVLPLGQIAAEVTRRVRRGRSSPAGSRSGVRT